MMVSVLAILIVHGYHQKISFFFELLPPVSHTLRVQTNPESPAGIPVNGVTDFPGFELGTFGLNGGIHTLGILFKPSSSIANLVLHLLIEELYKHYQ